MTSAPADPIARRWLARSLAAAAPALRALADDDDGALPPPAELLHAADTLEQVAAGLQDVSGGVSTP